MRHRLINFALEHGLELPADRAEKLLAYARRVLQKKDFLNLTGAASLEELVNRHLCDGLYGAAHLKRLAQKDGKKVFCVLDAGAGAGFIGLSVAAALAQAQVILAESLQKRCSFMNWVILQEGFSNVRVENVRLGQASLPPADYVIERAMGQLPDILGVCLGAVQPGGVFLAYQGEHPQDGLADPAKYGACWEEKARYQLPADNKAKHLLLCRKAV